MTFAHRIKKKQPTASGPNGGSDGGRGKRVGTALLPSPVPHLKDVHATLEQLGHRQWSFCTCIVAIRLRKHLGRMP